MSFEVRLDDFSGPMQLLLELIEKEDLAITEVSLATVTEAYVAYLNTHDVPSHELADFLVVAAKLLYLKSRALLPEDGVEEEGADGLAAQLTLYQAFVEATVHVDALARRGDVAFVRPRSLRAIVPSFRPSAALNAAVLADSFSELLKRLQPFFALEKTSMERVASVEERITHIHTLLAERERLTFRDLTKNAASRLDVLVSFLALLELMKQCRVRAVQHNAFGEIELSSSATDTSPETS